LAASLHKTLEQEHINFQIRQIRGFVSNCWCHLCGPSTSRKSLYFTEH